MIICGIEIASQDAILVLVKYENQTTYHIKCETKRLSLGNDRDAKVLTGLLDTIKSFSHQNKVDLFVIKSRTQKGRMAGGGITFKIETLFQLSGTSVVFVSPQTLNKFAKSNQGGIPDGLHAYQQDAYRVAAYHASKS